MEEMIDKLLSIKSDTKMMGYSQVKFILQMLYERLSCQGDIVEMGCHNGGTSILIQQLLCLTKSDKKLYVYDSFEGLPDVVPADMLPSNFKGKMKCTINNFIENFTNNNISSLPIITKGFFKNLTESQFPDKICLAFLDGDLYESIYDSLQHIYHRMVPGGIIIIDDYTHPLYGNGVKQACKDFFEKNLIENTVHIQKCYNTTGKEISAEGYILF